MKLITQQSHGWVFVHELAVEEPDCTLIFRYPSNNITIIRHNTQTPSQVLPSWLIGA